MATTWTYPVPREEFVARQDKVRTLMGTLGVDAVVVIGRAFYDRPGHLAYLTNYFPPEPTMVFGEGFRGAGHGIFFLPRSGEGVLLTVGTPPAQVAVNDVRPCTDLGKSLVALIEEFRLTSARIGIAGADIMPLAMYLDLRNGVPAVDWVSVDASLNELRRVKSSAEQQVLRAAVALADKAHLAARERLMPGATESEVCAAGTAAALAAGADFVRYFRVHKGPDSAHAFRWPQARPEAFTDGDLVTLDVIGAYQGYGFDVLRTAVVGRPSEEQRRVIRAVVEASEAMLKTARAGVSVDELARAGLQVLESYGYGQYARPFMGHGIGLETVEHPYLVPGEQSVLQAGEVLCIEPSLSIPGWGGASVERQVIITEEGCEVLDQAPVWWEEGSP